MRDKYDNIYHLWTQFHSPEECSFKQKLDDEGNTLSGADFEEVCEEPGRGLVGGLVASSTHWRCATCHQGTGNSTWEECPYSETLEHIVATALLELKEE